MEINAVVPHRSHYFDVFLCRVRNNKNKQKYA